jgi:hypothetical protein
MSASSDTYIFMRTCEVDVKVVPTNYLIAEVEVELHTERYNWEASYKFEESYGGRGLFRFYTMHYYNRYLIENTYTC